MTPELRARAVAALVAGERQSLVAQRLGITKSAAAGLAKRLRASGEDVPMRPHGGDRTGEVCVKHVPRARDDELLRWIALRVAGWSAAQVAQRMGVSQSTVDMATREVRNADLAESGEPPGVVDRAYWRGRG